jgi:hypothetical protein
MLVLLAGAAAWRARGPRRWRVLAELVALAPVAAVVALLLWPALRADPTGTARAEVQFARETGGVPHEYGSYFLGRPVRAPGPAFYPVALLFRLSPLVLLGLLLWALAFALRRRLRVPLRDASAWVLVGAAVVIVVMSAGPKKLERYALPAVPLLAVVAAVGYQRVLARPILRPLALAGVGVAQLVLCASARPDPFTFYSPLLGGAAGARGAIPLGCDDGLIPVARYLNDLESAPDLKVAVPDTVEQTFRAQVSAQVLPASENPRADYQLSCVATDQVPQRGSDADPDELVLTVRINSVDYARLYQLR